MNSKEQKQMTRIASLPLYPVNPEQNNGMLLEEHRVFAAAT